MSGFDPQRGFGIYVHWPYCARICPYCDFNVYAAKARDTAPLFDAILKDLEGWRGRTDERVVSSIFLGGGTPSLMTGEQVSRLIAHVRGLWDVAPGAEITLEANPDDVARFAEFADAGVDRLSLGLQSLDDERLKFLGRTHSAAQALAALEAARGRFRSISIDMIYAAPGQSLEDWRGELSRALALGADHLSLYELSIEPGAAFFQAVKRKSWAPASDDEAAELFEVTQEMTEAAGRLGEEGRLRCPPLERACGGARGGSGGCGDSAWAPLQSAQTGEQLVPRYYYSSSFAPKKRME